MLTPRTPHQMKRKVSFIKDYDDVIDGDAVDFDFDDDDDDDDDDDWDQD